MSFVSRRWAIALGLWLSLFVLLGVWSFSSPPFSYPDEGFHMVNSYCEGPTSPGQCVEDTAGRMLVPLSLMDGKHWWWDHQSNISVVGFGIDNYAPNYYRYASYLVDDDAYLSAIRLRLANSAIAATMLVLAFVFVHSSIRSAFVVSVALVSVTYGFFYMSSSHPLSWAVSGVTCLGPLAVSLFRHYRMMDKLKCAALASVAVVMSLSARRESAVAIALVLGLTFISRTSLHMKTGRAWFKTTVVAVGLVACLLTLLRLRLVRLIAPFNSDGFESLVDSIDLNRILRNFWMVPEVVLRVFGGTRNDNSSSLEMLGYWSIPIAVALIVTIIKFNSGGRASRGNHPTRPTIIVGVTAILAAPIVYVLPRTGDLLEGDTFPPRYLILLVIAVVFFVLYSLDPNSTELKGVAKLGGLMCLIGLSHMMSLYFNFTIRRSQIMEGVNIASPHLFFEDWWFAQISPMTVYLVGVGAMLALWRGTRLLGAEAHVAQE